MKLGFVPVFDPTDGGIYQYSRSMADALASSAASREAIAVVPPGAELPPAMTGWTRLELDVLGGGNRRLAFITSPGIRRGLRRVRRLLQPDEQPDPRVVRARPDTARFLGKSGIELMLFPVLHTFSFETGLPYVAAIHDLQHRLQPEFPEVSAGGQWERREHVFRNGARYASAVLADSEVGRQDILGAYAAHGLEEERVCVLPFVLAPELRAPADDDVAARVRRAYALPERYLFYPAQFWPHKNHLQLVEALGLLRGRGLRVAVALSGSWSGALREQTFQDVMRHARFLRVDEQLTVLGYVPQSDMAGLYRGAAGLVFPTFFGPTNIPIIEAWTLDCPVITSDIRGIREQVGEAGLLADPRDPEAIAAAIERLWTDEELGRELVARGRVRVEAFSPDDFRRRLMEILDRAVSLGPPRPAVTNTP